MSPRKASLPGSTRKQIVDAATTMVGRHVGELGRDDRGASDPNGAMSTDTHDPAAHGAEVRRGHGRLLVEAGLSGSLVRTADGAAVHVVQKGTGPLVVCIHGSGSLGLFWLPLLTGFRREACAGEADVRKLASPTLLVWGDHDPWAQPMPSGESKHSSRTRSCW